MTFEAREILKQLGGNRFIAMTGAKDFIRDDEKQRITFKIGRNCSGINYVTITLNPMDLYDIKFISIRGWVIKEVSEEKGVYNDMLQTIFTQHTGLNTHL